jgi:DNA-binding NtrC family response regulator
VRRAELFGGLERRYVEPVLGAVGGTKSTGARILGIDRRLCTSKLQQYKIS